jgi:hypothetical protein
MPNIHNLGNQSTPLTTDEVPLWSSGTTKKVTVSVLVASADPKDHTHSLSEITDAGSAAAADTSDFDASGAASAALATAESYTDSSVATKQPLDSDLTAIAALSTTSFGRGSLEAANQGAFRTYIGAGTSSFDGAYSSLTGTPSTFAPSAHATSHQPGGSDAMAVDAVAATGSLRTIGTGATQACGGTDSRLSDARTPLSHTHTLSQITDAGTAASQATNAFDAAGAASAAQAASQPLDADLTAIAALTTTGFGRGSLEVANQAAFRTYIGAGTSSFDGAYSSLSGTPSTFAPSAHVSNHQNGGSDEVATATAAANAIPKAGAGSTLAIGWIPTGSTSSTVCIGNDSRLSDTRTCTGTLTLGTGLTGSSFNGSGNITATVSYGTSVATACIGNDSRLSDTRTCTGTLTLGTGLTGTSFNGSGNITATVSYGSTASTACVGNDSRLSDTRVPTTHASTHAAAGSDPITITESQVTSLTGDLAAKAPLASPTFTGTPAAPTAATNTNTTQVATTAFASRAAAVGVLRTPTVSVTLPSDHSLILLRRYVVAAALVTSIGTNSIVRVSN